MTKLQTRLGDPSEDARKYLDDLGRVDLSRLLELSTYQIHEQEDDWGLGTVRIAILSPEPFAEALAILPSFDKKRIVEAICYHEPMQRSPVRGVETFDSDRTDERVTGTAPALVAELVINKQTMILTGTGRKGIGDGNDYYRSRQRRIVVTLSTFGIEWKNPHPDLWHWFRHYKEHFASYSERREYVRSLYDDVIDRVARIGSLELPSREPTGWERVDRGLAATRRQLDASVNEEDFQAVGLLCREVLISLGQAVYDDDIHISPDGVVPSSTDASRMLDAFISHAFSGASSKELRAHAKAALNLALNLQHRRTASRQLATLCLEATLSTTTVISILSNRNLPAGDPE